MIHNESLFINLNESAQPDFIFNFINPFVNKQVIKRNLKHKEVAYGVIKLSRLMKIYSFITTQI